MGKRKKFIIEKVDTNLVPGREKISVLAVSKLRCADCYLKERCPKYDKDKECDFAVDIKIEDAKDMLNILKALLVLQVKRINQQAQIERVDGGYVDSALSQEVLNFFEMVSRLRDLQRADADMVVVKGEGILSKLFGKEVVKKNEAEREKEEEKEKPIEAEYKEEK